MKNKATTFQDLIMGLEKFWAGKGCLLAQPYDIEVGAGTFHPLTFLRSLDRMEVMPDQLPKDEMLAFSEISGVLSQLLDILNNAANNIGGDEAAGMLEMLDQTVQTVAAIKASMKSKIPGLE